MAIVAALLTVGCGSGLPAPTGSAPPGPSEASGTAVLTQPPGGADSPPPSIGLPEASALPPGLSGDLACGNDDQLVFSADLLREEPTAELASDPAAIGLRRYVTGEAPPEMGMPRSGWRVVARSSTSVTFIAPAADGWRIATIAPSGSGWMFFEGGNCALQVKLPEGVSFATWRLDPAHPSKATSTEIRVLGTENACANGKPPEGRVKAPIVVTSDRAITIALLVGNVPGGADCPGNPEFPFAVSLEAPLGERALYDGSTFPPTARS